MILTVSTVKDTVANLEAFCRRNLAAGADHLLIFLDAAEGEDPDREVVEYLTAHSHVTPVFTDARYWQPKRLPSLNGRQLVNANLANALLAGFDWADWLFHIDADEALQIDRGRLLTEVGQSEEIVRVAPIEAVSQVHWEGEVTHFKPLLDKPGIDRLIAAGLIEPPGENDSLNATWFSGHVKGKVGVRPDLGVRLELHHAYAYDDPETEIPGRSESWLAHRHYESHDGQEFVRKWMAHLDAGPIRLRPRRRRLMEQIAAIVEDGSLDEPARQQAFLDLYRREVEDDLPALERMGVLVPPMEGSHTPEPLPDPETFARVVELFADTPKTAFNVRTPQRPEEVVRSLRAGLSDGDPAAAVLDRALARVEVRAQVRTRLRSEPRRTPRRRLFRRR